MKNQTKRCYLLKKCSLWIMCLHGTFRAYSTTCGKYDMLFTLWSVTIETGGKQVMHAKHFILQYLGKDLTNFLRTSCEHIMLTCRVPPARNKPKPMRAEALSDCSE